MELDFILQRLEAIDEKFDKKLDAILVQTTKTNGMVNGLERWRSGVMKFVWWVLGIIAGIILLKTQTIL